MEHLTHGRVTGFPPQLVCDWLSPEGDIISVAAPFYSAGAYAVTIAAVAGSILWLVQDATGRLKQRESGPTLHTHHGRPLK